MIVANSLAYYDTATIAAAKSFVVEPSECQSLLSHVACLVHIRLTWNKRLLELITVVKSFKVQAHYHQRQWHKDSVFL
jgi:hypothetical protein